MSWPLSRLRGLALVALGLLLVARPVLAKRVVLRWEPLRHTVRYELVIRQGEKPVREETLAGAHTDWTGDLPFGLYTYQVRAIDFTGRPGDWSPASPLVVMPVAPQLVSPEAGAKIPMLGPGEKVTLRWKESDGANRYAVQVRSGGKILVDKIVTGPALEVQLPSPGRYTWQVRPVIESPDRSPSDASAKIWKGKGDARDLVAQVEKLETPEPLAPVGVTPFREGREITFEWSAVARAEAYEVRIMEHARTRKPDAAAGETTGRFLLKTVVSSGTSVRLTLPRPGRYAWGVRALARFDASAKPSATGEMGHTVLTLLPEATPNRRLLVGFLLGIASYGYEVSSNQAAASLGTSATSFAGRGDAELEFGRWVASLDVRSVFWKMSSHSFQRHELEIGMGRRLFGENGLLGFQLTPRVSLAARQNRQIEPQAGIDVTPTVSATAPLVTALGPSFGLDLQRPFTAALLFGVRGEYFLPLSAMGSAVQLQRGGPSANNFEVGAYARLWLTHRLAAAIDLTYEANGLAYTVNGSARQLQMSQFYWLGGIVWGW